MICHQPVQMPGQMMYSSVRLFTIPQEMFVYIVYILAIELYTTKHTVTQTVQVNREIERDTGNGSESVTRNECLQPSFICIL